MRPGLVVPSCSQLFDVFVQRTVLQFQLRQLFIELVHARRVISATCRRRLPQALVLGVLRLQLSGQALPLGLDESEEQTASYLIM